jgi:taurine dioxygenase
MNSTSAPDYSIERLAPSIGAVLHGPTLANLDESDAAFIRSALLEYKVVFFRDQDLSEQQLLDAGRRFGELFVHPNLVAREDFPGLVTIKREADDRSVVGAEWHTDTTCMAAPPLGAILHARDVPASGGDTLFANQALAYQSLSPGLRRTVDTLRAVHNDTRVAGPAVRLNARRSTATREDHSWVKTENVHPVVRVHPETGEPGLFVNIAYTRRLEGMSEAESEPLLSYLFNHAVRPEFTCRFRWSPGAVAFWDNRAVKHLAVNDTAGSRRIMNRVQIEGDVPCGL